MTKYNSILETIGNTPVVKLQKLAPEGVNVYVKLESFNPLGSVKDRLALAVIEDGEKSGKLKPGQTVVEATSGNTGIGLAMVCAAKGYPLVITMAESFSVERRKLMRFLGAKVVLTPAAEKGTGMVKKAVELAEELGGFQTHQFENEANADFHSATTAQEILADFKGEKLDYWVTGAGTGGTLKGVARVLKEKRPETKVAVCEPDNSQILSSAYVQKRNADGSAAESHPDFRPHVVQGWTPDFVPKLAQDVLDAGWIDEMLPINGANAMRLSLELAQQEGIFVGTSAGATIEGALRIAERSEPGTTILAMAPDTGERYLTTPLFEDVPADMTEEEMKLSQSTPSCRFDLAAATSPAPAAAAEPVALDPKAEAFVEEQISKSPMAFFALEWCEFCWSVRKMLKALDVDYVTIDLDSVEYQKDGWGGKIRAVLKDRLGTPTIPQIFVAGQHIGGATEAMDAFNEGKLQKLFDKAGLSYRDAFSGDAYSFLPTWLQKR